MKFVQSANKQRDDKQGYSKKIYLDEKDLNIPGSLVQEVKVSAGERAEIHYHKTQTEIFYFFADCAGVYWIINGETIHPQTGDVLAVEPNDRHTLVNDSDKDYVYICFKCNYVANDFFVDEVG